MKIARAVLFVPFAAIASALGCGAETSVPGAPGGKSDLPLPAPDAGNASAEDAAVAEWGDPQDGGAEGGSCSFTVVGGAVPGTYSVLPDVDDGYSWVVAGDCPGSPTAEDCAASNASGNVSIGFECETLVGGDTYNIAFVIAGTEDAAVYPASGELYTGPIGMWNGPRYFTPSASCTVQAPDAPSPAQRFRATFRCETLALDAPDAGDASASLWGTIDVPLTPWQPAPR
jgi:hypothetical protein